MYLFLFLTVRDNSVTTYIEKSRFQCVKQCNDLYWKVQVFITHKMLKWEVKMKDMFRFLQIKAEIPANPCIF